MMLDWLSMKNNDESTLKKGSNLIDQAVQAVLKEGKIRTYDLGGSSSTSEVGDAIANKIKQLTK